MPIFDDAVQSQVTLEKGLAELVEQFGPFAFQEVLHKQHIIPPSSILEQDKQLAHVLMEDAVAHYFCSDAFQSLQTSSQQAYRYEMDMFIRYGHQHKGPNPSIKDVSSAIFLMEYLAPVKKLNTRNKKAAFLKSFLSETYEHFWNSNIEKLKRTLSNKVEQNREPRAFTKEQLDELLCLARLGREAHRNFTILWSFLGSGIRLTELCGLQVGDLNSTRQEIMVRGKGKKGYKQPSKMTRSSFDTLSSYVKFRYGGIEHVPDYSERYIFSDDKGLTPLHESTVQKMFAALIAEATTIPTSDKKPYQLSVHSLRHSFALYLLESGVNIYTIKELMRHAWLSSTEVYLKLFDSMLLSAIDKHPLAQIKVVDL
ncbi:tyrosine-type recombinase/integrase [Paenibacillus allorhizosphaerae]|uniref:Tyrosine recombinase XerC n=1 Tax=Paenibacillus allorhizosphaerae TaxID=2849866 RepID=A0ABM8VUB6_9BACL|nr:tyrosine-type recombinase/integrase [Paenibacillus allorhizosphaerae]CAG7658358.1 Tyrosine recombinase XerC [Paenibacillus allorhizosphaerae]